MLDAQQVQQGRVEIMHMDPIFRHVVAELIRLAENCARPRTAARHPD